MAGVKYIAPVLDCSGYGAAARDYVLAIHKQGYPITVAPVSFEHTRPDLGRDGEILNSLINKSIDYDRVIVHSTPDLWQNFTSQERTKKIIGYTVWETDALPGIWTLECNKVQEVWVPCDWNVEVFQRSGVKVPIMKVPHVVEAPETVSAFNLEGVSPDTFVFYSIFQWQERKNPYALLTAYTSAFTGVSDVILVLKTYQRDQAGDKDAVRKLIMDFRHYLKLDHYPKIFLIVENLSKQGLWGLHQRGDCFVLLQRSEGWGLPHSEAAIMGNPVITPSYGGQTEFLKDDNSFLVDYQLTPVAGMPWSPYYRADQFWCEPNIQQAMEQMRYVYEHRDHARAKGVRAQESIREKFSSDAIGKLIVKRLTELDG